MSLPLEYSHPNVEVKPTPVYDDNAATTPGHGHKPQTPTIKVILTVPHIHNHEVTLPWEIVLPPRQSLHGEMYNGKGEYFPNTSLKRHLQLRKTRHPRYRHGAPQKTFAPLWPDNLDSPHYTLSRANRSRTLLTHTVPHP